MEEKKLLYRPEVARLFSLNCLRHRISNYIIVIWRMIKLYTLS